MSSRKLSALLLLAMLGCIGVAAAADDENTGMILSVGKVNTNICSIKVQGATFPNSCTTAVYQEAYFTCNATEGKELLSIALAARVSGTPVRILSNACSIYGSSVANLIGIHMD